MRKTRENCTCFSLALGGDISANMNCEEIQMQGLGEELVTGLV